MKSRLDQSPLPQPEVVFARQQAVAQKNGTHPQNEMLDKVFAVGDEYILNQVGMIDE